MQKACESLRKNAIRNLDLSNKSLHDDDMIVLSDALRVNTSLRELYLSNNKLTDNALKPLCVALLKHPLEILYFTGNQIGDEGAKHLATYIRQTKHLKWLDLHMNRIGDEGGSTIASALHRNSSLEGLQLKSNRIGQKGQLKLLVACQINSTLQSLTIGDNDGFYEDVWEKMMEQLHLNSHANPQQFVAGNQNSRYILKFQQKKRAHLTHQFDLNEHLAAFLNSAELSDVKLVSSDGGEFFAHQCILYSRCKKLYREIHSAEKKSATKCSFPLSVSSDTLLRFLKFIYCPPFIPIVAQQTTAPSSSSSSSKNTDSVPSNLRTLLEYSVEEMTPELTSLLTRYNVVSVDEGGDVKKEKPETKEPKTSSLSSPVVSVVSSSDRSSSSSHISTEEEVQSDAQLCATHKLLMRSRLADIFIIPKDDVKPIPAHRVVLAARSPYFRGMFNSGMREAKENQITLLRSASALKVVLEYCYTGDVNKYLDSENAVEALEAAAEFAMDALKSIIETSLIEAIDSENVMYLLHLANTFQCDGLEVACMAYLHTLTNK